MIVCICRRVSDLSIRTAIDAGARTVEEVGSATRAGTGCGCCQEQISAMIHERSAGGRCGGNCKDCPRERTAIVSPYLQVA